MSVPYIELENFFSNFSFCVLFISMIFYWVRTGFSYGESDNKNKNKKLSDCHRIGMMLANFSLFSLLVCRWKESGHFPLSNLYESLMFLSWSFTTIQLFLEKITERKDSKGMISLYIGCITSPSALFTNAFATFSLPLEMQKSSSLVPALQSNWLMMHVTVMILSYAALICGSLLSIAFLVITSGRVIDFNDTESMDEIYSQNQTKQKNDYTASARYQEEELIFATNAVPLFSLKEAQSEFSFRKMHFSKTSNPFRKMKLAENLDNLSYRILGLGFPLLTIGILSGAVWANEAWGSYWSWDPKETWALITWLVFAAYLHARITRGWQGRRPAILAAAGFVVVWVCYLGVNLFIPCSYPEA